MERKFDRARPIHTILSIGLNRDETKFIQYEIPFLRDEPGFLCDGCNKQFNEFPTMLGYKNTGTLWKKVEYCKECTKNY